jgi:F-type H+-transporting ATPase subunit delta
VSGTHKPKVIAGNDAILARRYASALLDLAEEGKVVDIVEAELGSLQHVIDGERHFHVMATHPRLPLATIQKIIVAIAEQAKLSKLTAQFLSLVATNRRLANLGLMIEAFQAALAVRRGIHEAHATVAKPLTKEQQEQLTAQLSAMVKGTVRLVVEEDPSLMGGMLIKIGSRLVDATVKGKLTRLERQLKSQQEAA